MDQLKDKFQKFLDDGAKQNLLSKEFERDVEIHLGSQEDLPSSSHQGTGAEKGYFPDYLVGSDSEDDVVSTPSFRDPLDDETCSIISRLGDVARSRRSPNGWTDTESCVWMLDSKKPSKKPDQLESILRSLLEAINKDSGLSYKLERGNSDLIYIKRLVHSDKSMSSETPQANYDKIDEDAFNDVLDIFNSGIHLPDSDEPNKHLTISTNTPGFSPSEIKSAYVQGKVTVADIIEHIFKQKGRWNYIMSSYDVDSMEWT